MTFLLIAAALVVAAVLRLAGLSAVGFGSDEAVYAEQARTLAGGQLTLRAHPPLWIAAGSLLGPGANDFALRLLAVGAGLAAVLVTSALGASLVRTAPRVAAVAGAWIVAVMPYHVDVSRQFILDGPAATAAATVLLSVVLWERSGHRRWLIAAGAAAAAAVLIKESALLVVIAVAAVAFAAPEPRRTRSAVVVVSAAASALVLWFAAAALSGQGARLASYADWQLDRGANAGAALYPAVVAPAMVPMILLVAAIGAVSLARQRHSLVIVVAVALPLVFFQLWPVKGYAYVALVVPALCALAALGLVETAAAVRSAARLASPGRRRLVVAASSVALTASVALSAPAAFAWSATPTPGPLPGRDGLPAVREAAEWINERPRGPIVAAGTAVGNVIGYYSDSDVRVVGHGEGDRSLNPAYREPQRSADGDGAYFVWDTWTASEQPVRAAALVSEARRMGARVSFVGVDPSSDRSSDGPVIVVFEVVV